MHHRDIGRLHDDYKRVGRWCGAAIPNLPLRYPAPPFRMTLRKTLRPNQDTSP